MKKVPNLSYNHRATSIQDYYVLITGASKGIGRACALHLDQLGMTVLAGVRTESDGNALRAESSGRLIPILLDITNQAHIDTLAQTVQSLVGKAGLWGVVNNAGIAVAGPVEFVPIDAWRHQFEVNVIGQVAVTQALLPLLRETRGRIVMMSSIGGRHTEPMIGAYSASKHALEALSDTLRCELGGAVQVSLIEPGIIKTPIWDTSQQAFERLLEKMPPQMPLLYGPHLIVLEAFVTAGKTQGIPPEKVASAVAHALTARRPRTRYLVGIDARIKAVLTGLPDRLHDALINLLVQAMAKGKPVPTTHSDSTLQTMPDQRHGVPGVQQP